MGAGVKPLGGATSSRGVEIHPKSRKYLSNVALVTLPLLKRNMTRGDLFPVRCFLRILEESRGDSLRVARGVVGRNEALCHKYFFCALNRRQEESVRSVGMDDVVLTWVVNRVIAGSLDVEAPVVGERTTQRPAQRD